MIQRVSEDEERGALGMHYTSMPNILKVLDVVCGLYEARNEQKIDKRCYLVMPEMCGVLENEIYYAQLFLGMTRQGNPFIWPVRLPRPGRDESTWSVSAREAIVRAFGNWIRIGANMDLSAYDIYEAEIPILRHGSEDLGQPVPHHRYARRHAADGT
jgi:hypothetical protein